MFSAVKKKDFHTMMYIFEIFYIFKIAFGMQIVHKV